MARGRRNTKQYICDTFIGGGLIDRWLGRLNEGQMRFASHPHLQKREKKRIPLLLSLSSVPPATDCDYHVFF